MAVRIEDGQAQLLTRTGLDWTNKYPSAIAALANLNVKTAYLDGELCGVNDAGLPSFARKKLLEPLLKDKPGLQFNGHEAGDGGVILTHAVKLGFEGVISKTIDAPYASGNRDL